MCTALKNRTKTLTFVMAKSHAIDFHDFLVIDVWKNRQMNTDEHDKIGDFEPTSS